MGNERRTGRPVFPDEDVNSPYGKDVGGKGNPADLDTAGDEGLRFIARGIRELPDLEPPAMLLHSVMASVRKERQPLWRRILRWARSPRSITFTPLRLVPAAAAMTAICLLLAFHILTTDRDKPVSMDHRVQVVLALRSPGARSVSVIGSFNGWQEQKCELHTVNGEPNWTVTLLLESGRYEYAFVVDGEKIVPDPGAGLREDDGFGNQNAILLVGNGNGNSA